MHLKIQKRNGREYLSVVQSYRQAGKVKSRTVETIGYADDYAGIYEDPVAHFRAYVAQLNEEATLHDQPLDLVLRPDELLETEPQPPARLGAAIAVGCLDAIGVGDFFRARSGLPDTPAHVGRIFEMLAAERMMHATSKRESWTARSAFPRTCDFSFQDVYAALPSIASNSASMSSYLLQRWTRIAGSPDVSRIFLICGSYAFPVDGGAIRSSIAVAIDRLVMPLGHHDIPGRLEPLAFSQAAHNLKDRLGAKRTVVVAGGLRHLEPTIAELTASGDGFILYQRDFERIEPLAAWAQNDEGYTSIAGGVSVKWRETTYHLPDGRDLPVKEVMLRGGGYAERNRQAVLVTSELDLTALTIVQLYRELWRQAEPFQPLEADFSSVPFPTDAHDHIQAHFALCYAAFTALRTLRWRMGWSHNAADTADGLLRMEGGHLQRNYYLFSYRSEVTDAIENAVGIPMARKLRTREDLREVPRIVRESIMTNGASAQDAQ